jgi:Uncharacterized protein conserved in bacteria (DUF2213)
MSVKLVKDCIIARSGIYNYKQFEVKALGLSLDGAEVKDTYNVYRPPIVLESNKSLFTRLPITNEHPNEDVNNYNFRKLAIGFTGDSADVAYDDNTGEVILKSSVALMDNEALNLYNSGIVEVSPGYMGVWKWKKGFTKDGLPYDIVMTDVKDVNHLAITRAARGGRSVKILDSAKEVKVRKLMTGLWRTIRKTLGVAKDSDMASFRDTVNDIVLNRQILTDEDVISKIGALQSTISDLPDTSEKEKLLLYMQDFALVKDMDEESAKAYGNILSNLYEKLDVESEETIKDETMEKPELENKEAGIPSDKPMEGEQKPESVTDESATPELKPEAPKEDYSLPEIMTFIKEIIGMVKEFKKPVEEKTVDGEAKPFEGKETPAEEEKEKETVDENKKEIEKEEAGKTGDSIINVSVSTNKPLSEIGFAKKLCAR